MARNGRSNVPAIREEDKPATTDILDVLAHALDPGILFDDIAQEGVRRGLDALKNKSLVPLMKSSDKYPITSYVGDKLSTLKGAVTKIHKLIDDQSSHGPYKGSTVRTVPPGSMPNYDRYNKRPPGSKRGSNK